MSSWLQREDVDWQVQCKECHVRLFFVDRPDCQAIALKGYHPHFRCGKCLQTVCVMVRMPSVGDA